MSQFNENNTVEEFVKDILVNELDWKFIPSNELHREITDVIVEDHLRNALIRLNPEIQEDEDRADEVIHRLRAILFSARGSGLVRANEEFSKWIRNQKTMPFGKDGLHTTVRLIDYDERPFENNEFIITNQYTYKFDEEKRPDWVLLINGLPVIIGEAKSPVRPSQSWFDGASDIEQYQESIPQLFIPNVFCFASEGKKFKVGSIGLPLQDWKPWRKTTDDEFEGMNELGNSVRLLLKKETVLDILRNFTMYSSLPTGQRIKIMCRYQQYEATHQIVERVKNGEIKKGLVWHFQGSGKTFLMIYVAMQLRKAPELKAPTVIFVVDRKDLQNQMYKEFDNTDVPNTIIADSRKDLKKILLQDTRKIILTTIQKFEEGDDLLNDRDNIIILVDEAHRSQEGEWARYMRKSLPNAFFFGFTGTPINLRYHNTFTTFGHPAEKYLSKYSYSRSIADNATLKIYFDPRIIDMHIDADRIDDEFNRMVTAMNLSVKDQELLSKQARKFATIIKHPKRISLICKDIAKHYKNSIEPNGFKGQVVTYDRESCHLYKQELDKYLKSEESAVVMTLSKGDPKEWKKLYSLSEDEEIKLLQRYNDPSDPLKLLIVTSKLLTGFNAPINQAMYLDKPMKDHVLLQAICRVNRPYKNKEQGIIIDYIGVFDNVTKNLNFDEEEIKIVVSNIENLKKEFEPAMKKCLLYFEGLDRTIRGHEGLFAAQERLDTHEKRDKFAADFRYLVNHWDAISPDRMLEKYQDDYQWLALVYNSILPTSGRGKLLWHNLGKKTMDIVYKNVQIHELTDNLDVLVLDENIVNKLAKHEIESKSKELEVKIRWRLQKHTDDPRFIELGKRLEELKEKHYNNVINSIEFLKEMLDLGKEIVITERETKIEPVDNTKEALTRIFLECKVEKTPVIIEEIVNSIDDIVKLHRFPDWQWTIGGEREIKQYLRQTLLKYQLHKDQELFNKAYNYIREHY